LACSVSRHMFVSLLRGWKWDVTAWASERVVRTDLPKPVHILVEDEQLGVDVVEVPLEALEGGGGEFLKPQI
jgi:hypothetical protein